MHEHAPHHHEISEGGSRNLIVALLLNLGITAAQVIGGLLAGSLSLLADAAHNFSDAASLGISYGARRIARRRADRKRTFGYRRAEVIGALINLVTLVVISLYLLGHAIERFFHPQEVQGIIMLIVGGIAFVEDLISAALLYRQSKESVNIQSAFLHMVGDTLATLGVIIGSLCILFFDLYFVDPLLTALIAVYILVHSFHALRGTIRLLMESTPQDLDFDAMVHAVESIDGVCDLHHVHVWRLDEHRTALEAHVAIDRRDLDAMEHIKQAVKQLLHDQFGIEHATLEVEFADHSCHERSVVPKE